MIDKLEKDVQKLYEHFDKMDFRKTSEEERWEVRLGAGASKYISGPTLYGFLLGQWAALKHVLIRIDQLKFEEAKKPKTNAFIFRSDYEYYEDTDSFIEEDDE